VRFEIQQPWPVGEMAPKEDINADSVLFEGYINVKAQIRGGNIKDGESLSVGLLTIILHGDNRSHNDKEMQLVALWTFLYISSYTSIK